jgi:hypothetical protein
MAYINLPVVTDSDVLIQQALTNIASNNKMTGWIPREGNLEVLLVEQFALMAAESATVASNVPDTIFQYFGSLVGITPNEGSSATIYTTWNLVGAAASPGYTIPANTIAGFFYAGASYEFTTLQDFTVPAGSTSSVNIVMQAASTGSAYNIQNLSGLNPLSTYLQLSTPDPNISSVVITGVYPTSGLVLGTDPETTDNFLTRLALELQLLAPRPITPSDYALFSQNISGIYRSFAFDGFNPFTNLLSTASANFTNVATAGTTPTGWATFSNGTVAAPTLSTPGTSPSNYLQFTASSATTLLSGTAISGSIVFTGNTTSTSSTITSITSFASLYIGQKITGSGIPASTTITGISQSAGTITISNNATTTATGVSLTAGVVAGATQLAVAVGTGNSLSTTISPTYPALLLINDATGGGNEIVQVVGVQTAGSGASTVQTATIGSTNVASTFTGTTTSTSAAITVTSIPTGIALGQLIVGTGIPAGAYVISINSTTNTITISANATASASVTINTYSTLGFSYAHVAGVATVTQLQGASSPAVSNLSANTQWLQAASIIQAAGATPETNATASPYIFALATYVDNSVRQFSSVYQFDAALKTYTSSAKTIFCNILSTNNAANTNLTNDPGVPSVYTNLDPYITSVQMYVAFAGATASKTHKIFYNSVNQTGLDISGVDNPSITTSSFNFIPDATLTNYNYANGTGASWGSGTAPWSMPSSITALPNYGVQYSPTTTGALGSTITISSQIFSLPYYASDNPAATSRTYTLFANIDASYSGTTYGKIAVQIIDANTSSVLATFSPPAARPNTDLATFNITSDKDVQVQIVFTGGAGGLNVPLGSSVIVSNIGVLSGTYTGLTLPEYEQENYAWTPGGLYAPTTFNYPRTVTIASTDTNGLPVSMAIQDTLEDYLQAKREVNFIVQTIQPNYVPIDVAWTGYVSVGYVASSVQGQVNTAIRNFLNPATWAGGGSTPPYWDGSQTTVRIFDIAGIISSVPGVASVTQVQIRTSWPVNGTYGSSDISLPNSVVGYAQLPLANVVSGTMYTNAANAYSGLG